MEFNVQLRFNIKPVKHTARTCVELVAKFSSGYLYASGSNQKYLISYPLNKERTIRFYSIQKFNRKTKVISKKKREVIREAFWQAYVYTVPEQVVKCLNLKIYQHDKFFTITQGTQK